MEYKIPLHIIIPYIQKLLEIQIRQVNKKADTCKSYMYQLQLLLYG